MKKETYEAPVMEIVEFETEDIITTSGTQYIGYDPDDLTFVPDNE